MKTEIWNGYEIRFIEKDGEWWAIAKDVATALAYTHTAHMVRMIDAKDKGIHKANTTSEKVKCPKTQDMLMISEFGIQCQQVKDFELPMEVGRTWHTLVLPQKLP